MEKIKLFRDSFQNFKQYQLPRAQFVVADIPYQLGDNAFGSNPQWYIDGDNKKGESEKAHKSFFHTDNRAAFGINEFFLFCRNMLKKEDKKDSPCMLIFCAFQQQFELIEEAKKWGFNHYINLVFRKNFSAQVLKANMRVVNSCEYGLLFYRERLPKFRNEGQMIFNCFDWVRDTKTPKVHPTQKPVPLLEALIKLFTDPDDVVIDPVAGSGTTLLAAANLCRRAYGFEIDKNFYQGFYNKILPCKQEDIFELQKLAAKAEEKRTLFNLGATNG